MKFVIVLLLIGITAVSFFFYFELLIQLISYKLQQSCFAIISINFRYPTSTCSWFDIERRQAVIPFCWPNGFPYQYAPPGGCYPNDPRAINPSIPCVPPILPCPQNPNGCIVPPCNGRYIILS